MVSNYVLLIKSYTQTIATSPIVPKLLETKQKTVREEGNNHDNHNKKTFIYVLYLWMSLVA